MAIAVYNYIQCDTRTMYSRLLKKYYFLGVEPICTIIIIRLRICTYLCYTSNFPFFPPAGYVNHLLDEALRVAALHKSARHGIAECQAPLPPPSLASGEPHDKSKGELVREHVARFAKH
jgi:hypothetical protein